MATRSAVSELVNSVDYNSCSQVLHDGNTRLRVCRHLSSRYCSPGCRVPCLAISHIRLADTDAGHEHAARAV